MAQNRLIGALWNATTDPKWTSGSVPDRLAEKILQNDGDQIGVWMLHVSDGHYCMEKNGFLYRLEEVPDAIDNVYDGQSDRRREAHHIRLIVNQMVLDDNAEYLNQVAYQV